MKKLLFLIGLGYCLSGLSLLAQGTAADYTRTYSLADKYRNKVLNADVNPVWIGDSDRFWYMRTGATGEEYVIIDAIQKTRTAMPDTMKQRILTERNRRPESRYWAEQDEDRTGDSIPSPDKRYKAFIKNSNVYVKEIAAELNAESNSVIM